MSGHERIRGEGLSHTYLTRTGETLALSNLDLTVGHGEFCGIVGPSGCGKSTLLAIICGLLQPTQGRILIDGMRIRSPSRRTGILLQKDHLFEWRTVLQNAELGLEIQGTGTAQARRLGLDLLSHWRDRCDSADELSEQSVLLPHLHHRQYFLLRYLFDGLCLHP